VWWPERPHAIAVGRELGDRAARSGASIPRGFSVLLAASAMLTVVSLLRLHAERRRHARHHRSGSSHFSTSWPTVTPLRGCRCSSTCPRSFVSSTSARA
jgi:hypothetical protein